ncbi:putative MPP superfamily phosphohydrolase [Actinoplanes tereljensis]|uniref:Membrane protein n=1 Tax=Paractinoplanes tereljensis TaxID=571912 RepID=A0A919NVF6_9ACTN|nr:metallophosphoesterase [Actinoplanes tereljensis]GIF24990.1 membrane protein [Actinoplanes tereljensis]
MLAFVALVFLVIGLIHFYLYKRLLRDPLRPGRAQQVGAVVATGLGLLLPATLIGTRTGHLEWLAWPGYLWLALMFYLLVVLILLEIPRAAVLLSWRTASRTKEVARNKTDGSQSVTESDISETGLLESPDPLAEAANDDDGVARRLVLARGMAIFAGLTAAGITGYGMKTALGGPQLDRVSIPLAKLPRGMDQTRLAVVSDIHLGPLTGTRHAGRIVDLINSVQADIVCVVGDLVDGSVAELGRFAAPLADIESRYGAFFVTGNHEYYSGFEPWLEEVTRLGMRPLRNERLEINGLDLAGVNDLGGAQHGDAPDFGKALGDRDTSRPVVLMAHQPAAAHQAAPYGVDLQVSGHTHGGQMAPFNLLVKLEQPVVSGYGKVDGVPVYVTNGAGFWGPPVRVGAPPQVTVVELRTA